MGIRTMGNANNMRPALSRESELSETPLTYDTNGKNRKFYRSMLLHWISRLGWGGCFENPFKQQIVNH